MKQTPYRHIIWDWNGTLWNDTWLCVEINNQMLSRRGLPEINTSVYRDKLCFPVEYYYSQLGFDYAIDPYRTLADEFITEYSRRRFECPLQKGARELIAMFSEQGLAQSVLSAYQQEMLLQAVEEFGLTSSFQSIIGLNDVYAAGKVENGKKYIATLNLLPEEVLFVGDTLHDFEVAQAMGIECVLVANGHNSRPRLERSSSPVFETLDEVGRFVQSRL